MRIEVIQDRAGLHVKHEGKDLPITKIKLEASLESECLSGFVEVPIFSVGKNKANVVGEATMITTDPSTGQNKQIKKIEFVDGSTFEP